jgi:flagellar basal body-associated protein FliL
MNGVDFNDEFSETDFTFRGTGGGVSTWVIIMGTIILGLLVVAILIFMTALKEFLG